MEKAVEQLLNGFFLLEETYTHQLHETTSAMMETTIEAMTAMERSLRINIEPMPEKRATTKDARDISSRNVRSQLSDISPSNARGNSWNAPARAMTSANNNGTTVKTTEILPSLDLGQIVISASTFLLVLRSA